MWLAGCAAMPMPAFPLARLGQFRAELHACFTRRADALFELGDALLCAQAIPSLPHLSLEPAHRRGWGSVYAALARGEVDAERLRDLLVGSLDPVDPPVFAVDVTTWPRCDAECSPERGYYYHPSRHSAGQPIVAGWAYQWIAQLGFDRDSWTAPVDAQRLHPLDDTDQTAAGQVRALLARLPASEAVPLFVFDGGYDSAQLSLDLADAPAAVLVRLRSDRCFYADPPPRPLAARAGRAATAPSSTAPTRPPGRPRPQPLPATTTSTAPSPSPAGQGCTPSSSATPATAAAHRGRSCAAPSSASRSNGSPRVPARPRCCGCGGRAPRACSWISTWPGGRISAGSTWNTPSGSPSRPSAGPPRVPATPSRPTAGPGWCWPATPSCALPAPSLATSACRGSGADPNRACRRYGSGAAFRSFWSGWLASERAETRRMPTRPAQGPLLGTRDALPGD
jgi:hypothetical protein